MTELEKKLGYTFKNPAYLTTALTHSSYANENKREGECNERLEFLGDAVLGLIVARYLYAKTPAMPEGKMTRLRADLVCERNLDVVASKLDLGSFLRLGKGEEQGGGRTRPSIIADAVEATLAAIFLDGGMGEAEKFVNKFIISAYEAGENALDRDYKTDLQELVQRKSGQVLSYTLVGEAGPDHAKTFTIAVLLNGEELGTGTGRTKKTAEQLAAKSALERLR